MLRIENGLYGWWSCSWYSRRLTATNLLVVRHPEILIIIGLRQTPPHEDNIPAQLLGGVWLIIAGWLWLIIEVAHNLRSHPLGWDYQFAHFSSAYMHERALLERSKPGLGFTLAFRIYLCCHWSCVLNCHHNPHPHHCHHHHPCRHHHHRHHHHHFHYHHKPAYPWKVRAQ